MMMGSSSGSIVKRYDNSNIANLLLRTDGFKNTLTPGNRRNHKNSPVYTSLGKRQPVREYHFIKEPESRTESRLQC